MSALVVAGDTSGTVTLQAPATAGSVVVTLPAASGTMLTTSSAIAFANFLASDWTNSKNTPGYTKLPNGIIIQWGVTASIASGGNVVVTWPTAFLTNPLAGFVTVNSGSALAGNYTGAIGNMNTTTGTIYNYGVSTAGYWWLVIGS